MKQFILSGILITLLITVQASSARPTIPKRNIPEDVSTIVKREIERLYSAKHTEWVKAAHHLGEMKKKAAPAIPFLISIWSSKNDLEGTVFESSLKAVRREAIDALVKIGNSSLLPLIHASQDEDSSIRKFAVRTLEKMHSPQVTKHLLASLSDSNHIVRKYAAIALGNRKEETAVDPLRDALFDNHWKVRASAAEALGKIKSIHSIHSMITALSDTDNTVHYHLILALSASGKSAVEPLIEAFSHTHWRIRSGAAEVLGNIKDKRAIDPLIVLSRDVDRIVRRKAVESLGKIGEPDLSLILINSLRDPDRDVRKTTINALTQLNDKRSIEAIIPLLKDVSKGIRRRAQKALVHLTGKNFGQDSRKWKEYLTKKNKKERN